MRPAKPNSTRVRAFYAVQERPGSTLADIAAALEVERGTPAFAAMTRVVRRMRSEGLFQVQQSQADDDDGSSLYAVTPGAFVQELASKPKRTRSKKQLAARKVYNRNYQRAAAATKRAKAVAEKKCVNCLAGLAGLEGWKYRKCPECLESSRLSNERRRKRPDVKAKALEAQRKWRNENRADFRAYARDYYWQKKLSGVCRMCSLPVDGESNLCATHHERFKTYQREWHRKYRAGKQQAA
jgi:hypothetical protein